MSREYLKKEQEGASFEELEYMTLGALRRAVVEGDVVNGTLMAGQIAGLIDKKGSCQDIVEDIMAEAERLLAGSQFCR